MPRIRPDVVRRLVSLLGDDTMSVDARIDLAPNSDATESEQLAAIEAFTGMAIRELVAAGTVEVKTPRVLDLTMRELRALCAIYSVVSKWDISLRDDYRLESAMKVIPPEHAALIDEAIRYGRLR